MVGVLISSPSGSNTVTLKGDITWTYQHRIVVESVPEREGDIPQPQGRKSRLAQMKRAQIYTSADAIDILHVGRLRGWADGGAIVYVTSLMETLLPMKIMEPLIIRESAEKGFILTLNLVEVV